MGAISVLGHTHPEVNPAWLLGAIVIIAVPTHAGWALAPLRRMLGGGR